MGIIRGGISQFAIDGRTYDLVGDWTYNLGAPKRTALVGATGVLGPTEEHQAPFIEGVISDSGGLSVRELTQAVDVTITLQLRNGKGVVFRSAWWAGEGNITTAQGQISARFEALQAEET